MKQFIPGLAGLVLAIAPLAHAAPVTPELADLAARVMPAVVSIASTDPVTSKAKPDNLGNDGGSSGGDNGGGNGDGDGSAYQPSADTSGSVLPPPKAEEALGSGFVIDPAGYIVTNNHVINGASSVSVTFQDGTILPATIVGRDKDADLAVLKVDAGHKLAAVTFGDSSKLRVGDWVLAIGNPFGLPGSTTAGIVSALDRNINADKYDDFIQTDASINRGNSGGPLFDLNGKVIGVNSAIYSPSGGSIGIGFAIPSAMAAPVANALEHGGAMNRGWIGASTEDVTPEIEKLLALPASTGALVGGVAAGSPAVGVLSPGDVITSFAGQAITNPRALFIRTAEIPSGTAAALQFWRDGTQHSATLTLRPPSETPDNDITATPVPASNIALPDLGVSLASEPSGDGIKIDAVNNHGAAAKAGIVAGDIIAQLAGQPVTAAADLKTKLDKLRMSGAPQAVILITGDDASGADPGPRWVALPLKAPAG